MKAAKERKMDKNLEFMKILNRVSSSFLKLLCNSPDLFSGIAQMCQGIGIRLLLY